MIASEQVCPKVQERILKILLKTKYSIRGNMP